MFAHLFFPENDVALGRNLDNYTAPGAAVKLRMSGYALPAWFMGEEDCFIAQGVNAQWLNGIRERFGIAAKVFDRQPDRWEPCPWGWSRASRRFFRQLGFTPAQLPADEALERIRNLSHRRTAAEIARKLALEGTPVAEELTSIEAVEAYVKEKGDVMLKLPWSSSGRGLLPLDNQTFEQHRGQIRGMLANQGSVMGEPRLQPILDFAMLFTMTGDGARYEGLSMFRNSVSGNYEGNLLAPQTVFEQRITELIGREALDYVRNALPTILTEIIGDDYRGPLGVDMMIYNKGGEPALDAAVELNLRNTMGHVALRFHERFCAAEAEGELKVVTDYPQETAKIENQRLQSGTMALTPPGNPFTFVVTV